MPSISLEQAANLVTDSNGKIFGVTFIKRTTGELRKMTCRVGVSKYVTGVGRKFDPAQKNLLGVYETNTDREGAENYRMIDLNGIVELRINGNQYEVER